MITLSQLAIYPIKSSAQISLTQAKMGAFGLENDRRWMLVDNNGTMLTQRKHARMCLIECALEEGGLLVSAPDMPQLKISSSAHGADITATIWSDSCNSYDCGNEAAEWFSRFLKTPARLVYFPDNEVRQVDLNYAKPGELTAFSDGFPYLLIGQASLDDLNKRLNTPVAMKRFRPNLVISGAEPFAEDNWKQIRIGDICFNLVKPCSRCIIPSIDPDSASKSAEPTKTLASYRMRDNKIFFGQNVIADGEGELKTGMNIEILSFY